MQLGRGHTKGDTVGLAAAGKILFSGDPRRIRRRRPYNGDAYLG
jgi:hypothetical protein